MLHGLPSLQAAQDAQAAMEDALAAGSEEVAKVGVAVCAHVCAATQSTLQQAWCGRARLSEPVHAHVHLLLPHLQAHPRGAALLFLPALQVKQQHRAMLEEMAAFQQEQQQWQEARDAAEHALAEERRRFEESSQAQVHLGRGWRGDACAQECGSARLENCCTGTAPWQQLNLPLVPPAAVRLLPV